MVLEEREFQQQQLEWQIINASVLISGIVPAPFIKRLAHFRTIKDAFGFSHKPRKPSACPGR